jgi:type II restriction/modification system DNA methylase subunit YeeA
MDTSKLRKFASFARSALIEQVGTRLKTVLAEKSLARRESPKVVEELEKKIKELGEKRLMETVAYTWFNRFCALRYMDVNRYTRIGVLSPADGQFQPEILAEAKMGHIDEELVPEATRKQVMRLLDGSDKNADPQGEAYRLLLVAVCNYYHSLMPFMFEKIADYTELLLPDDLLSGTSLPAYTREALLPINSLPQYIEDFKESVEVIGWLYQFYVADKKDEVFDGIKKGAKITPENIPAATQLFTPHWIVRYLVENSLGRLWMLNHPDSKLVERMEYYIKPEEPETNFLKISSPEEIKVCDPACGSGHMLTYAFDLLYEIYREEQYPEPEIPSLILRNNLYGIEIDPRAGALAAFALTMKAREKDKRFFTRKAQPESSTRFFFPADNRESKIQNPNICVLENIKIDPDDLSAYMDKVGRDLFTGGLQDVVNQWEESDNFGSLIRPLVTDISEVLELLLQQKVGQDLFLAKVHQQVLRALQQADYLSPKYHVVVANPPYMGGRNMNSSLKDFLKKEYSEVRTDVFSAFIVRNTELACESGQLGFMSPFVWMFLSSYEELRKFILDKKAITSLVQLEYSGFDGATVPICTFTIENAHRPELRGGYIRLTEFRGAANQGPKTLEAIANRGCRWFFRATSVDFEQIPGSPIAYWVSERLRSLFSQLQKAEEVSTAAVGLQTGDNDRFMRFWHEVSHQRIGFDFSDSLDTTTAPEKWVPYNKGGAYRKWFGNREYVVNWKNGGAEIKSIVPKSVIRNERTYFKISLTWSEITSSWKSFRYIPGGSIHDVKGQSAFFENEDHAMHALAWLNSNVVEYLTKVLNPTLSFQSGDYRNLPMPDFDRDMVAIARRCVEIAQNDWDRFETSWSYQKSPLQSNNSLESAFSELRNQGRSMMEELRDLESQTNEKFITKFKLGDDIRNEITSEQLTLDANPHHRYGTDKSDSELESLLLSDTMREFISYAAGCMFGRYSLDKPGLILANQGGTVADYLEQIPEPKYAPDDDNVIPVLEGEWFSDDISQRFKDFLKITFGTEHYDENLQFLENALYPDNPTAKKRKTIRDYFLKEFYEHHLKMYKKRPIYWLFSSPRGTFNALIYMHRYRPETVGKVLECLRDFREKLAHHSEQRQGTADSASESKAEKTKAVKDVAAIKKQLKELEEYEKSLFEVASRMRNVDIDLDNGVKHNYLLFGPVLRKIPGLDAKDD